MQLSGTKRISQYGRKIEESSSSLIILEQEDSSFNSDMESEQDNGNYTWWHI